MNNNVPFLNWGFMVRAIPEILKALPMTLNIAIVTMIFSLILSFFIALVRINKIPVLTRLATIYVSFIRGTPLLVQIYLAYYGLPKILDYIHLKYQLSYVLALSTVMELTYLFLKEMSLLFW